MSKVTYNIVFIKEDYFKDNNHYEEMLDPFNTVKQARRQYIFLNIQYQNNNILVPLRSIIPSNKQYGEIGYSVPSEEKPNAGLDFRKILIVNNKFYIEIPDNPKIPRSQQQIIEQNYIAIKNKVINYINGYIKSVLKDRQKIDAKYKFSTLHNFYEELGITKLLKQQLEAKLQTASTTD